MTIASFLPAVWFVAASISMVRKCLPDAIKLVYQGLRHRSGPASGAYSRIFVLLHPESQRGSGVGLTAPLAR